MHHFFPKRWKNKRTLPSVLTEDDKEFHQYIQEEVIALHLS